MKDLQGSLSNRYIYNPKGLPCYSGPAPEFAPGDEVLVETKFFNLHKGIRPKLAPCYLGPFKVLENVHGTSQSGIPLRYPARDAKGLPSVPVSAINRYHRSSNYQPPPPPEIISDEPECEVDWIADTRGTGSWLQYKVYRVG
jgi:hypothetical protein